MQEDSIEKKTPNLIRPHLYQLWMHKATAGNGPLYFICTGVFIKSGKLYKYELTRVNTPLEMIVLSPEDFDKKAQDNTLVQIDFSQSNNRNYSKY